MEENKFQEMNALFQLLDSLDEGPIKDLFQAEICSLLRNLAADRQLYRLEKMIEDKQHEFINRIQNREYKEEENRPVSVGIATGTTAGPIPDSASPGPVS